MEIRLAQEKDLMQISELQVTNWRKTYEGLLDPAFLAGLDPEHLAEQWREYMPLAKHALYVCAQDDTVIAYVACMEDGEIPDCMYLDSLQVSESCRGSGIGTRLIGEVFDFTRRSGLHNVSICVMNGNDRAKKLYTKLGAEHIKSFDDDFHGTVAHSEKLIWKNI